VSGLNEEAFARALKPVEMAPPLWRANGFGVGLYGVLRDPRFGEPYWKIYFLTALWIPIVPVSAYLVVRRDGGFSFYRKMSLWSMFRHYGGSVVPFFFSALLEGAGWLLLFGGLILGVAFGMHALRVAIS